MTDGANIAIRWWILGFPGLLDSFLLPITIASCFRNKEKEFVLTVANMKAAQASRCR
jgi:hypothetical protein